jgi:transposase-like protein
MAKSRRVYTPEFRVEAAHRVIDSGRTIVEVAAQLGVGAQLLGRWVKDERTRQAAAQAAPPEVEEPLTESERAELVRLRRRVVEQERKAVEQAEDVAFLKKASAYFASMQPK